MQRRVQAPVQELAWVQRPAQGRVQVRGGLRAPRLVEVFWWCQAPEQKAQP